MWTRFRKCSAHIRQVTPTFCELWSYKTHVLTVDENKRCITVYYNKWYTGKGCGERFMYSATTSQHVHKFLNEFLTPEQCGMFSKLCKFISADLDRAKFIWHIHQWRIEFVEGGAWGAYYA